MHESPEGGGNENAGAGRWLLTYADMITLLMIFFIVLYAFSKTDVAKYRAIALSLHQALGGAALPNGFPNDASNSLVTLTPTPTASPQVAGSSSAGASTQSGASSDAQLEQMAAQLRAILRTQLQVGATIAVGQAGLEISFRGDSGYFASASAQLKPAFETTLLRIAPVLKETGDEIRVEGFTNDLPLMSSKYPTAWELSAARADHVLRFLTEVGGLPPHQMDGDFLGQWHPQYPNNSPTNLALNRSVDILVTRSLPVGLNEGGPDVAPPGSPAL